ncbi:hypothetical protein AX17_005237 [Amanita inopinata Kibby_2008]|nr:hypothetical protein AX17_005237 [Amanita inopinata Kibby_2008]
MSPSTNIPLLSGENASRASNSIPQLEAHATSPVSKTFSLRTRSIHKNKKTDINLERITVDFALQARQLGAIDPRLLSAPCGATSQDLDSQPSTPANRYDEDSEDEQPPRAKRAKTVGSSSVPEQGPTRKSTRRRKLPSRPHEEVATATGSADTVRAPSRNILVSHERVMKVLDRLPKGTCKKQVMECEICQKRCSKPGDLGRHVWTHDASGGLGIRCTGVLLEDAQRLEINMQGLQARTIHGQERVGGCQQGFSRKDALMRHIKRRTNSLCYMLGEYRP